MDMLLPISIVVCAIIAWDIARRLIAAKAAERVEKNRLDTYEAALKNGLSELSEHVRTLSGKIGGMRLDQETKGRRR